MRGRRLEDDGSTTLLSLRIPSDLSLRLNHYVRRIQRERIGNTFTRSDAARELLTRALRNEPQTPARFVLVKDGQRLRTAKKSGPQPVAKKGRRIPVAKKGTRRPT